MLFFKQERKSSYGDIPKKIVIGKIKDEKGNIIRAGCSKRIDESGRFEIIFDPLGAGTDTYTLILEGDGYVKQIDNILFGDVYVMAGQSNIEMRVEEIETEEIKESILGNNDTREYMRLFCCSGKSPTLIDERGDLKGEWVIADREGALKFSAVGFEMLKTIQQQNILPVGGILIAVGGSSIDSWATGFRCQIIH